MTTSPAKYDRRRTAKYYGLLRVEMTNGLDPKEAKSRPYFESLTAIFPNQMIDLETPSSDLSGRLINLISPIRPAAKRRSHRLATESRQNVPAEGDRRGRRANYPDIHLMVALIGEGVRRSYRRHETLGEGRIIASTFDEPVEDHTRVAGWRSACKRLVGAARTSSSCSTASRASPRLQPGVPPSRHGTTGGMDPVTLPAEALLRRRAQLRGGERPDGHRHLPRRYRQPPGRGDFEGSRAPATWGSGLARRLAERRTFPAIDIAGSTRAAKSSCSTKRRCAKSG